VDRHTQGIKQKSHITHILTVDHALQLLLVQCALGTLQGWLYVRDERIRYTAHTRNTYIHPISELNLQAGNNAPVFFGERLAVRSPEGCERRRSFRATALSGCEIREALNVRSADPKPTAITDRGA
jgi:hypothetical protein